MPDEEDKVSSEDVEQDIEAKDELIKLNPKIIYSEEQDEYSVKYRSPLNIELVKFWGIAHDYEVIPTNNSLSVTLNKK